MPILTRIPIKCRLLRLFPLFLLLGMRVPLLAQCALSCNDGLQVSLDLSGQALITTQLIAPNSGNSCPGPLTLTLYNSVGQQLPNPLTCNQIGQVVTARVKHTASGNFCTGTLEVYDALSPTLGNCGNKFIFCNEDPSPEAIGFPNGTDNCTASGDLNFNHFDTETALGCGVYQNGFQVLKRIDRNWTATDDHGNSSTCLQKVWLKHFTFADIAFPLNLDNISSPALACGQDPEDLDLTGQPTINGVPVGASPDCEMAVSFSDQTIMHCAPAGFTVLRNWTAIDFCSGTFTNRIQIIKVQDTEAPELTAPDNLTVGTDGFYCSGTVVMPQAVFSDNCSAVTVTPFWDYGTGYGPFSGVAEGEHLVTYVATDACGNSATATMLVTVVDSSPPQAICASDLQVSLSSNGAGYVNAGTVDQGSFDNCGPVFLSISRDEVQYGPQVQVNCADQGAALQITLRVTDAGGLENFCQMEVMVRDFLKPTIQCPPNLTLNCLQDYNNLALTGQASASDNCALQSITHQDFANIQPCNIGSVIRWWTATDSAGNTKTCSQQITVNTINTTTVSFPANTSVASCSGPASLLPSATGKPVIGGQACSPLSVNYTDQIFSIAPPSCFRIFREWKVVDHCIYNPNGGSAGIWEQTQIIDVVDNTPPLLSIPADVTVGADPFSCTAVVNMSDATATDCSDQISFSHDSNFSGAGNTNNASGQYPMGVHFVTFSASDGCGNTAQQTLRITVKDLTPPVAVCLPGVSVNIPASGFASLDPSSFDGGCSDFCSPQNGLLFSVQPASFDCQQLGLQPLVLTVKDTAGNSASCNTQVLVKDNAQVCGGGLVHQVEGTIRTETGLPVNNIPVSMTGYGFFESTSCDTLGHFGFEDIPTGRPYTLKPYNNANWVNGVTTYDLVLISKHILGSDPFTSPYKIMAADANHSGSITTFDIVQLRKLILGILDSLPANTSWRFVDSSFVFPDAQNPFSTPIPEEILFDSLVSDQAGRNFIGLKVGDVNGSTNPATARIPHDTVFLSIADRDFKLGERFTESVFIENWTHLEGFQFALKIDPAQLEIEQVEFLNPEILGQPNVSIKDGGGLWVSWNNTGIKDNAGLQSNGLFRLHLSARANSTLRSSLSISGSGLAPEAYHEGDETQAAIALSLNQTALKVSYSELSIFPNPNSGAFFVKNPFLDKVSSLRISDVRGQLLWEREGMLPETVEVNANAIKQPGLYLVEWKSAVGTRLGKVLVTQ